MSACNRFLDFFLKQDETKSVFTTSNACNSQQQEEDEEQEALLDQEFHANMHAQMAMNSSSLFSPLVTGTAEQKKRWFTDIECAILRKFYKLI